MMRRVVQLGLVIALAGAAPPAPAHPTRWHWPYAKLIKRIDNARIPLPNGRARVAAQLVICNGEGRGVVRRGVRRWRHFTCTQTLFRGGVDRDVTFRVHVRGETRFTITHGRYGPR